MEEEVPNPTSKRIATPKVVSNYRKRGRLRDLVPLRKLLHPLKVRKQGEAGNSSESDV